MILPMNKKNYRWDPYVQKFQQILQRAISSNALKVSLCADSVPQVMTAEGTTDLHEVGETNAEYLTTLFNQLFPKGIRSDRERGEANIPSFGVIKLLAMATPPALHIYMPSAHQMFDQDWGVTPEAAAPTNEPAPDSLAPFSEPPADMFAAPVASSPAPSPTPAATASPAPDVGSGFVPSDLAAAPVESAPSMAAPPTPDLVTEDAPAAPTGGGIDLSEPPPTEMFEAPAPVSSTNSRPRFQPANAEDLAATLKADNDAAPIGLSTDAPPIIDNAAASEELAPPAAASEAVPLAPPIAAAPVVPVAAPDLAVAPQTSGSIMPPPMQMAEPVQKQGAPKPAKIVQGGNCEIDESLRMMLDHKASDIHFTSNEPIALRVDGEITRTKKVISEDDLVRIIYEIMPDVSEEEFEETNDTDFAYEIPGLARFRVNVFRDRNGVGVVIRHIPSTILSFEQLNLPPVIAKLCGLSKGLVVVTGPTGSGKSTTLAAMVDYINETRPDHILTLEDPVEFVHTQKKCLIHQRELKTHTTSFARALKAALREDPDIILIGELRDLETTALAIEIAETGHLVLGTLHTTTAVSTIDRVIDQFPADSQEQIRTMLSESLKGVVAQTLLKKNGGGRVAALEVLVANNAVSALIREGKTHMLPNHMQSQKAAGNKLLNDSLMQYVVDGVVSPKEAYTKAINKDELVAKFQAARVDISFLNTQDPNKKAS